MQFNSSIKGLALATALAATPAMAADYVIDTQGAHASINFKIDHLGFSYVVGRFNDFEGSFTWDAEQPEDSSAEVTIRAHSIDSNHAERDRHLRGNDYLNVNRYDQASFSSTHFEYQGDGKGLLTGDLTLMGETRSIDIEVEHYGEGEDPWGEYRAGFTGTTALHLPDFGIQFNLGPAAETVYMDLHVEGVRQ